MESILESPSDFFVSEKGDSKTRGWFLTGSPVPVVILLFVYYRFVKKIGPNFMKDRKPFNIDKIVQIYNLIQVFVCGWMAIESFLLTYGPGGSYSLISCTPMNHPNPATAYRVASFCWMYYMLKLFDLFDTIFFVLRKKFNQITFLHVYHHIAVTICGYLGSRYYPDGHGFLLIPLNNFVHAFMYSYYFITNYNPEYKKKIWWKKYITQIQIIQFLILSIHFGKVFLMSECNYPLIPVVLFFPQNIFVLILFLRFYKNTYLRKSETLKTS